MATTLKASYTNHYRRGLIRLLDVLAFRSSNTHQPVIEALALIRRASVARWLRWLRERGLLGVVESGTTPRFAPLALAADAGNRASLYVLCVPARGNVGEMEAIGTPPIGCGRHRPR